MKAIILAAGEGRRLRPLTENMPKCLVPVNGKPLLEYWLENCEKNGIGEVLINGYYLVDQVQYYLNKIEKKFSMKINFAVEEELSGTGGFLKNNREFVGDEGFFFFCHGDNFTNIDIAEFIAFHRSKNTFLSVALFKTNLPKQCGIADEIDDDGKILRFIEKPDRPKSNLASAAIFLMSPTIIDRFPNKPVIDFSKEVLPKFQGEMYGFPMKGFNIDIGTPENYRQANEIATQL